MKKIVALTLSPFFLFANPSENVLKEKSAVQQENLDYLFDSKFPLDDYTYKRKPNPNNVVEFEKNTNEAKSTQPTTIENVDELAKKEEDFAKKLAELEKKAQAKKEEIKPQPKPQPKPKKATITPQQRMDILLRDSILAERGAQEIYFSQGTNPYGVDSFSNQENIDNVTNEHKLFRMVRAGRLIPATLTTAISSDLAGLVSAQIEEDIYATNGKSGNDSARQQSNWLLPKQ